jgi:hypothetical protein
MFSLSLSHAQGWHGVRCTKRTIPFPTSIPPSSKFNSKTSTARRTYSEFSLLRPRRRQRRVFLSLSLPPSGPTNCNRCTLPHPVDTAQCLIIPDPPTSTLYKIELRWHPDLGAASCDRGWPSRRLGNIPKHFSLQNVKHSSKIESLRRVKHTYDVNHMHRPMPKRHYYQDGGRDAAVGNADAYLPTPYQWPSWGDHKRRSAGEVHPTTSPCLLDLASRS